MWRRGAVRPEVRPVDLPCWHTLRVLLGASDDIGRVGENGPTQIRLASVFAARMAASHGLNTFLVWVAFTSHSVSTAGWVLVARAVAALVVPLAVGHLHDRGSLRPWLRGASVAEALAAASLAWFGWNGTSGAAMVALSLLLGSTSSLFDTIVHPMLLTARPGRLKAHVLVGLSYDMAKVVGSSAVLALIVTWNSPWPVMGVSLLALAGWRLQGGDDPTASSKAPSSSVAGGFGADATVALWQEMPLGPVVALAVVALLPGQAGVLQVVLAEGSFRWYAALGTSFAVGAVLGNLLLQRVVVRRRAVAVAYVMCALSMVGALLVPFAAFALYGATMASYFQLTRVIVVESSAPEARGRVSAAMTAVVKVASIGGSVIATAMVHHATALFVAAASVALVAAAAAGARRRVAATAT